MSNLTPMTERPPTDLFTPEYFQSPHETHAWLRANQPVYRAQLPFVNVDVWVITRYSDVRAALSDRRFSTESGAANAQFKSANLAFGIGTVVERSLLTMDGEDHTRLKRIVGRAFTPEHIEAWREKVQTIIADQLDGLDSSGPVDLLDAFAAPLAVRTVSEVLGLPGDSCQKIRNWGDLMVSQDPEKLPLVFGAWRAAEEFVRSLIARKRAEPAADSSDLLSVLISERDVSNRLSDAELTSLTLAILVAGYHTTMNLICNGLLALFDHPVQMEMLKRQPSLIKNAVEEFVRYEGSSFAAVWRFPTEDLHINGTRLAAGDPTLLLLSSANRDPAQFANPDVLDIVRAANSHVGLGHGVHFCLGAHLSRLEAELAIPALLERFSGMTLAASRASLKYNPSLIARGVNRLPINLCK